MGQKLRRITPEIALGAVSRHPEIKLIYGQFQDYDHVGDAVCAACLVTIVAIDRGMKVTSETYAHDVREFLGLGRDYFDGFWHGVDQTGLSEQYSNRGKQGLCDGTACMFALPVEKRR